MSRYKQQWEVPSSSSKGKRWYTVSLRHDGTLECSCMNWTRTMPREDCKHCLKIRLQMAQPSWTTIGVIAGETVTRANGQEITTEPEFATTEPIGRRFR